MKRWTSIVLVSCAAAVAAAQWVVTAPLQGILGGLLLVLVALTVFSQRSALNVTLRSLRTAHREQIESERRYRALFDACSDVIVAYAIEEDGTTGPLVEVNEAACTSLGYPRETLMAMDVEKLFTPDVRRDMRRRSKAMRGTGSTVFETVLLTSRGQLMPVEVSARLVEIRGRKLCLAVARDVAVRKEREERLRGMSYRDELTGLLNRRGFFAAVDDLGKRARRRGAQILVTYVDVDGLKLVNDSMGHAAGDEVLVAAADVLRLTFRENDVVARMGGDEFVALAVLGHPDDLRLDQDTIMARLESAASAKRGELGEEYSLSLSCGTLVVTSEELGHIDELLARTDERMYEAKRSRRFAAAR